MLTGMLKVIFFYIFIWWFKKTDSKKELTVRSIIATILSIFCFIAGIVMFTGTSAVPEEDSWGFILVGIVYLVLAVLFLIRIILDVRKILKLNPEEGEKQQKTKEAQQTTKAGWLEKSDREERLRAIERYENLKKENEANRKKSEVEQAKKKEDEAKKKKEERDNAACMALLDECGMLFFIEYYPQLKRLPIRDVVVSDHYFPERQVRLPAAKKIIDDGLTECALHYIIDTFGDVFSAEAIDRAKTILNEIKNEKGKTK